MIELSIRRPSLVVVLFATLTVLAVLSFPRIYYELTPKFAAPIITVMTVYPGAAPAEVENGITIPIEDALSTLEAIRGIRSASLENASVVTVQLAMNADVDGQIQEAQRRIDALAAELPESARAPVISRISSDDFPILNLGATAQIPPTEFYSLMRDRVIPALQRLEGVGTVNLLGGQEREIQVNARQDKLEQYRVSILQILEAVRKANLEFPTGNIQDAERQTPIRLAGRFASLEALRKLVVATSPMGNPIALEEVADILDTQAPETDLTRVNGAPALGLSILKQSDANAVEVSRLVRDELARLESQYTGQGLTFEVATDTSEFTVEAVRSVTQDLVLAVLLVSFVMVLFLHSLRNSLIVLLSIPASLVTTIIVMAVLGYTFNVLTLLAMSLVIGILVDDSIVVLENIFRHIEMGKSSRQAARDGAKEIFLTALSITLVLAVVFLPLILSSGIVAIIMRQFAVVVTVSILMSLLVSYTVAPSLAARLSRQQEFIPGSWGDRVFGSIDRGLESLSISYRKALSWSLDHPFWVLAISTLLVIGSVLLITAGHIGTDFLSTGDRGEFIVQLELPKDATLKESNLAAREAERFLMDQPEVTGLFTLVGRHTGFLSGGRSSPNLAEFTVKLVDKERRPYPTSVYSVQFRNALLEKLPGVRIRSNEVSFFGGANDTPIQVVVSSSDLASAQAYAEGLLEAVRETPGTVGAEMPGGEGAPQIVVDPDRARMGESGIDMQILGFTLAVAFNGNRDAMYYESGREHPIAIRLADIDRDQEEDIGEVTLLNRQGQLLKINQIATIRSSIAPAVLQRENRVPSVTVQCQVLGRPVGTVGEDIQAWIDANPPPAGVNVSFRGDLERQAESFSSLLIAFVASLFFVYFILVALYDSYLNPFVVLFAIPVALVGALLALALNMESLNVFSLVGIIMLNGLVAKNAILLVDFARQSEESGLSIREALLQAGEIRLRPILMTAISLIIGMMPIALAGGAASEWKNGLAWVIIGGLTSSTLLTLLLVPVIYQYAHRLRKRLTRHK